MRELSAAQIGAWLCDTFGLDPKHLRDESPLFSSGKLDSFNLVELVAFVEAATGARIRTIDINLDNFDSVARIVAYLRRIAAGASAAPAGRKSAGA